MERNDWSIVFYVDAHGNEPVAQFLASLDLKTRTRFDWSIEQLRLRNVQAREPLVKHLEGKLWELREESQTNIYRLLYFFSSGRQIVAPTPNCSPRNGFAVNLRLLSTRHGTISLVACDNPQLWQKAF